MACMSIVIKTTKYKEEFHIIIIIPNKIVSYILIKK